MKAYQIGPGRIMVWRNPALNTKCRHFLNNIQLWLNYIELIELSTQRIYILDNTTILDICRISHGSCFGYYSPELLPSRDPSTNRKMIEKDRTFSRFALSFYSYYTSGATMSSPGTICRWVKHMRARFPDQTPPLGHYVYNRRLICPVSVPWTCIWLQQYCRPNAVTAGVLALSRCVTHTDILPITCCHRMPHCWHIYALTVYHNIVAIVPTWCNRAVRMLLYADVECSFLAARVLSYGVFLPPEYRHSLSNATNVYLGMFTVLTIYHVLFFWQGRKRLEVFGVLGDFLLSKRMEQRVCIKFCVKNGIQCS